MSIMSSKEEVEKILSFANSNPSSWLATSADGQPHVRGMLMWYADETGFYYHTARSKRMIGEMTKNPKVSLAFIANADKPSFSTLHVDGVYEEVKDEALTARLKKERAWLWKNIEASKVDDEVVIFRIKDTTSYIWDMSWNVHESEIPRVRI